MTSKGEIRSVKENQFWLIGNNKAVLGEGNIIHIVVSGPQDHDIVHAHFKLHRQITALVNSKVSYLINLDEAGKFSPDARKLWNDIADRTDTLRIAFIGSHPVARVFADFIIIASERFNMQFFDHIDEAVAWLNEVIKPVSNID
jgi:hypothetical protein